MQLIVLKEIEQLMRRPNIQSKAQYVIVLDRAYICYVVIGIMEFVVSISLY